MGMFASSLVPTWPGNEASLPPPCVQRNNKYCPTVYVYYLANNYADLEECH